MNPRTLRFAFAVAFVGALGFVALPGAERERRRDRERAASTPATTAAAPSPGAAAGSFEAFDIIATRNIFDPNRVGRTRATPEEKPVRVDEISLVGTVSYNRERIALFESPDAAFRKAAHEGETVAEFTVRRIVPDGVELVRDDKPVTLKVTQQLRRPEGGDWTVTTPQPLPANAGDTTMARTADAAAAASEVPADASEALKRLLEKRKKQLK